MITAFNHVGISVSDLERSIAFYRDLLSLQVIQEVQFEGARYESILALRGAKGRIAVLRSGNFELELFEFERPAARPMDPNRPVSDRGISHFALQVEDLNGVYERLHAAGVSFHCPPIDFGCAISTYLRDPDGNVIEMLQLPAAA